MSTRIAVRTLAEFVHRRGDLYPPVPGRVTAEEGIEAQRLAQRHPGSTTYRRELPVEARFELTSGELILGGRVDGCDLACDPPLVEEIKATRAEAAIAEAHLGSAHWAQLRLYAALLAREPGADNQVPAETWHLRLRYCHPDSEVITDFDRFESRDSLIEFLDGTLSWYQSWLTEQADYVARRNQWLNGRAFPYDGFRPHQRAMARRAYRAFCTDERLLLEAPTGGGKTMGLLYPALKALAGGHLGRVFYLTSRSTGAIAARDACADLADGERRLRHVELIAKEKACPVAGMPCAAERCEYARGYYDRIHDAVRALLTEAVMDPDTVQRVAAVHKTCPFELSLDAALWADVVIGDYNYLLDPVVRLQRFAQAADLGVLVDESHQLTDRTREMLSLRLERGSVRRALGEALPEGLMRRLRGLDRSLLALRRSESLDVERVIGKPEPVLRAIERVLQALGEEEIELEAFPATRLLIFDLSRWARSDSWWTEEAYCFLASAEDFDITLSLACLDPADYLREVLDGYGAHVRFSGTVSPLSLYQRLHGHMDTPAERVESAFRPDQLALLVVDDLPVYYRERARTLSAVADLAADICAARRGNYLIALPSFEYLEAFSLRLGDRHPDLVIQAQRPGMSHEERAAFIGAFEREGSGRVGIVVLGGVFSESVDFSHAPLAGVICIGAGLPPMTALRTRTAERFDEALGSGGGELVAYRQPAMTKIVQMAGRLLRGPDDRGVLCLIDPRFRQADYQQFFPAHWRPQVLRAREVRARLDGFWQ